ncbi:hypothetical protein KAJ83_07990 [Marivibrio halodurans]|uniref:DUF6468 domain-containing protein n=1 Tax=Marivibrio halodurans TaxID=2039722 RepID=A0A8J7RZ11_9PROT|nr:DUF6468 domain-containing protein [Marivibrio halodurans]MBP5856945.1 hypothetical protein [Marivibrio halodurans]
MEPYVLSLVLDVVLACLLAAVIWYGFRLNRQLSALRKSREELKGLLEDFARSTDRAEAALDGLKRGARENIASVKQAVDKAEALKDDLVFLTKRGEEAADRLEAGITNTRPHAQQGAGGKAGRSTALSTAGRAAPGGEDGDGANGDGPARGGRGKAKRKSDLLRALQGMR